MWRKGGKGKRTGGEGEKEDGRGAGTP